MWAHMLVYYSKSTILAHCQSSDCRQPQKCVHIIFNNPCMYTDIRGLTLTTSHQGFYCPNTTAVLICTAMQTIGLRWTAQGKQIGKFVPLDPINRTIHEGPYTLTLISVTSGNHLADFVSSLQVPVNDIENGTNITCEMQEYILIYKECK